MKTDYIQIITISLLSLILIGGLLTGCGGAAAPQATETGTNAVTEEAPPVAVASDTPTSTPRPTNTPTPAPSPTEAVPPTFTPLPPTSTPTPTNTPTPAPPTSTPYPTQPPATNTPTPTPDLVAAAYQQGRAYFDQGLWAEAIPEFQRAIELNPDFAPAYRDLGNSFLGQGECEPAVQSLETYLALAPSDAPDRGSTEESLIQIANNPLCGIPDPPEGKALFVFVNRGGNNWRVGFAPYLLEVPRNELGQEFVVRTLVIDPGSYTWHANGTGPNGEDVIATNSDGGGRGFDFTVTEGEIHVEIMN